MKAPYNAMGFALMHVSYFMLSVFVIVVVVVVGRLGLRSSAELGSLLGFLYVSARICTLPTNLAPAIVHSPSTGTARLSVTNEPKTDVSVAGQ